MAIIFVDSTASGANDGTSWTDAYTSLNTALQAANIAPGDQVLVSGTFNETVTITEVAASANPNTIQGDDKSGGAGRGNPALFTIDGQATRTNCLTSNVGNGNLFYIIEDMRCTDATGDGCNMTPEDHVTFKRCRFDNNGSNGINGDNSMQFEECQADNNGAWGFNVDDDGNFLGCTAFTNTTGGMQMAGGSMIHCLVYGVGAGDDCFSIDGSAISKLLGCTADGENTTADGFDFSSASQTILLFANNIAYDCGTGVNAGRDIEERTLSRNNLVNSNTTDYSNFATFSGEVTGAPAFTDEASDDYTLQSGSPAKAAGTDAGDVVNDVSYMDIGAHQREEPAGGAGNQGISQGLHTITDGIVA